MRAVETCCGQQCMLYIEGHSSRLSPTIHITLITTLQTLEPGHEYGDQGSEDLTPDDVRALLERLIQLGDLDPASVSE